MNARVGCQPRVARWRRAKGLASVSKRALKQTRQHLEAVRHIDPLVEQPLHLQPVHDREKDSGQCFDINSGSQGAVFLRARQMPHQHFARFDVAMTEILVARVMR